MNRYAFLLLPLFTLAGCLRQGNPHSPKTPVNASQAAPMASPRQAAEPGQDAAAAPAERALVRYSLSEAAVQLEHDYAGRIEPDVAQTLTLRFRHGYRSGLMLVELYAHDGLELYNAEAPRELQLDAAQPLILPIELTAPSAGEYYLSIFATVELANGEVARRIFGLDLKAGDESEIASQARQSPKTERVEETASGERIVVMPLQEVPSSP